MPQFLIGKAPFYDANYYNEEREFGLPRMLLKGHEELSAYLLRRGLDAGFDLAFSNELRVDHSITCPIITVRAHRPTCRSCRSTPISSRRRCPSHSATSPSVACCAGSSMQWPSDARVAVIGTGHLSLELGGPRQFGPHGPDPEFDRKAVKWIANGDIAGALAGVSLDSLWEPGNATHGFLDFMLMMGVAGGRRPTTPIRSTSSTRWRPTSPGIRRSGRMSKYLIDKFLFTVDRDPELVERYRADPRGTVTWWETERANVVLNLPEIERSTWLSSPTTSARRWRHTTISSCSSWARIHS